uniref:Uncharacterized protein AlNc14C4G585 n=1 Tax=Albugo laibachii Nc14 TaxID=890382 RepID=F0W0E2_9STRA|nr:conserved hypothetical protein [Albugo laibachii Nc14]|eukprot:CCA14514.1 conserved hypothetical protein [Albugo laibachii Nc14]
MTQEPAFLVLDYLRSKRMHEAANLFASKASIADSDAEARWGEDRKSKLETILTERMRLSDQPSKEKESCSSSTNAWNGIQIERLKAAIKKTKTISDKASRWAAIAAYVGASKKSCYLKYKELKTESGGGTSSAKAKRSISGATRELAQEPRICSTTKQNGNIFAVSSKMNETRIPQQVVNDSTLLLESFEDFVSETDSTAHQDRPTGGNIKQKKSLLSRGRNLKHDEADAIRGILFPSSSRKKMFGPHWEMQGFFFTDVKNLRYGLVQVEGGPCGVLAVVQAYVIKYLSDQISTSNGSVDWQNVRYLFIVEADADCMKMSQPDKIMQHEALASSLTHILEQASQNRRPQVVLTKTINDLRSKHLRWVQDLQIFEIDGEDTSGEDVKAFLMHHLMHFMEPKGNGLVLFVLSVILSAGIDRIRDAMDTGKLEAGSSAESGCLIGSHEYCTQELVNLLLCGHAVGNVFDNTQTLDFGPSSQPLMLKGIPTRGTVGFLTLFESYNYIQVGSFLKSPEYNIWVICSESHYSVLFMPFPHILSRKYDNCGEFDLFYYDALANQEETIRLTVTKSSEQCEPLGEKDELIPPLDLVIRTKWPSRKISWNDTDPLL